MGEKRRINMIFLVVKNEDDSIEVISPETYGMDTWGQSSQTSLKQRNDGTWYIHYWSDGGQWLPDVNEDIELEVLLQTVDVDEVLTYVIRNKEEQLTECFKQVKQIIAECLDMFDYMYIEKTRD